MNSSQYTNLERVVAALILIAAGLQLAISCYYAWPFTTDDAFISWRYARQLVEGHDLRWNPTGVVVEGYSNFAWVIIVSLWIKLGLPLAATVKCFACLSLASGLFFLYQLSRTFVSLLPATLPVYIFSHYNGVAWWTVSGLETSFFIALVLFVTWQSVRTVGFFRSSHVLKPFNANAWILTCLALTLSALTRFDGIVWSGIVVAFIGCSLWRSQKLQHHFSSLMLIFIVFFVLPYTLYFVWRIYYFKQFLPNSYACKIIANEYPFQLIIDYLPIAFPCLILSLPYFFDRKDCRSILLWLPSVLYALLLCRANPIIAHYNRLLLPAFSVFALLPVLGIQEFFSYFDYKAKTNALASALIILLFTQIFIPGNTLSIIKTAVKHYQQRSNVRLQIAQQLNREALVGAHVLLADCGIIPFYARADIVFIDSLCLNNKDMTSNPWKSLPLYAKYVQEVVKPQWVIDTYYPKLHHGNELNIELQKAGFFNDYQLVKTYQSHRFTYERGKPTEQEADFIYRIYRKQKGA